MVLLLIIGFYFINNWLDFQNDPCRPYLAYIYLNNSVISFIELLISSVYIGPSLQQYAYI